MGARDHHRTRTRHLARRRPVAAQAPLGHPHGLNRPPDGPRAEKSFREDFPASDETTRLALAWQALAVESRSLAELNRHEAHLRRIVDRSISKLLAIGEARSRQQHQDPLEHQGQHEPQSKHENAKNEPDTPTDAQRQSAAATIIPITSRPGVAAAD